jgi:hypothetical protein
MWQGIEGERGYTPLDVRRRGMKELKRDLKGLSKLLNQLGRKTEQMAKRIDKLEATRPAKKRRAKTAVKTKAAKRSVSKKAVKTTAVGSVLDIITESKKGVDTATLSKKTGFESKKIWNVINSLKAQGKVKSAAKGVYVRV